MKGDVYLTTAEFDAIALMRRCQRLYFLHKRQDQLLAAKDAERRVDAIIDRVRRATAEPALPLD